jgi:PAS domain S-box-containing protein
MSVNVENISLFNALSAIYPYGMVVYDASLKCTIIDQFACDMLHIKKTDIIQKSMSDLFSRMENTSKFKKFCQNLQAGKPYSISFFRGKEHFAVRGLKVAENIILSLTNIPEEKFYEEQRKVELDALLSNISSQVFFKNNCFEYTSINKACAKFHDSPPSMIVGKTDYDLFPEEQADTIREEDKEVLRGKTIKDVERPLINHNGHIIWVSTTKTPLRDSNGNISGLLGISFDITESRAAKENEKKLEMQLMQSQKMEAVGRLAGGIAHDFNNILTAILGYSELVIKRMDEDDPNYRRVFEISRAGKRAAALTKKMLAFSKKQAILREEINVNQIISEMVDMLQHIIGENIKMKLDLESELASILSDVSQIEQIIMNLVINAKDAMPAKGAFLKVSSKNTLLKTRFSDGNFNVNPGNYIMIAVEDNGCGIGDDTSDHIFEPFYSKKRSSSGTGLGLSTVYGIVKQHNGYIQVESAVEVGSIFKIFLPASSGEKLSMEKNTESLDIFKQYAVNNATVLIVEDEEQVLDLSSSILRQAGYQIIKSSSAEEALHLFNESKDIIDLLLTDAMLPGMNGYEFSVAAKAIKPNLKILFMSGYPGEVIEGLNIDYSDNDFILKPFTIDNLLSKVGEMMKCKSK